MERRSVHNFLAMLHASESWRQHQLLQGGVVVQSDQADHHEFVPTPFSIRITMVHAEHSPGWENGDPTVGFGAAVGYVLGLENGLTLYVAGDTALFGDIRTIGEVYGPDIALLPMHYGTFPELTGTPSKLRAFVEPAGVTVLELTPGNTAS